MVTPPAAPPPRPDVSALDVPALDVAGVLAQLLAVVLAVAPGCVAVAVAALLVRRWLDRRAHRGACWVSVLPPPQADPAGATLMWAQVAGLLIPSRWRAWLPARPHVSWEYVLRGPGVITLGIWVPATVAAPLVASAVRAAWPGSRTEITEIPPDAGPGPDLGPGLGGGSRRATDCVAVGGVLRLARPGVLPLADTVSGADPLAALLGTAGLLGRGQWARVQVLARPVPAARLASAVTEHDPNTATGTGPGALVARLARGVARGLLAALAALVRDLVDVAGPSSPTRHRHGTGAHGRGAGLAEVDGNGRIELRAPGPRRVMATAADRAVAGKASGSGSGAVVLVRYTAAAPVIRTSEPGTPAGRAGRDERAQARAQSRRIAHAVAGSFAVFGSGHNRLRRRWMWGEPGRVMTARRLRRGDLLSAAELGALAHLPTAEHVAGLRRAGAAAVAPPPQIPGHGTGIRPVGDADAVSGRPVGITVPDARHHLWIVGATGTGKSTLLVHSVLADAAAGRAVVVLDPKGDLISEILPRLPDRARGRVVLVDPGRPLRTPAGPVWPTLNPLSPHPRSGVLRHGEAVGDAASEHVVTIFSRVFASAWGFRSEDLLRVACLTVRAGREVPTLSMLPALLSDPDARDRAVGQLPRRSPLREFWTWFDSLSAPSRANIAAPLLNKLRSVLLRPFAERVLCGGASTVDLTRLLDRGGLLLVRLPKLIGEDTVKLLGSLVVAQVWQAALTRAAIPEHARRDAHLILDECQNFLNLPVKAEDMLAESRGLRLSLTLAHQNLDQLTPELRHGIATNARSKIIFGCAAEDATRLARHTEPEVTAHDLHHLDAFHAAARVMAAGAESRAFTLTTRDLPPLTRPPSLPPGPAPVPSGQPVPPARHARVRPPGGSPCPTPSETRPVAPAPPARPSRPARGGGAGPALRVAGPADPGSRPRPGAAPHRSSRPGRAPGRRTTGPAPGRTQG